MKPYYEHAGIVIYHGDCREILPGLEVDAVVVTDPPYGISHKRGRCRDRGKGLSLGHAGMVGDDEPFDPMPLLVFECVIWGANHFAQRLPVSGRWLVWDKVCHGGSGDFSEAEVAWHSRGRAMKIFRHMWLGVQRDSQVGEVRRHPTEKPLALLRWCIGLVGQGVVLDPYLGSGTTLRAAKDLGRQAIGIEIEERYCEIAAKRLGQSVLDFGSPPVPKTKPEDPDYGIHVGWLDGGEGLNPA